MNSVQFVIQRAINMPVLSRSKTLNVFSSKPCFPSRLPGLSKVNWTNWVEFLFEQSTDLTWGPDVADFKIFVLFNFYRLKYNEKKHKKITLKT